MASGRREALLYGVVAVVASAAAAVYLRVWRADLRVPFFTGGDATAVLQHYQTVLERGWYEHQPRLGAPAGQVFHDFPTADNLHLAVARVLMLVVRDAPTTMNLYYLVGFPLAALAAAWFLRTCGVSRWMTLALSVLYSLAPYHFYRNENHLWLASYYPVPLALVVVLRLARGERIWGLRTGVTGVRRWLGGRGWLTAVSLVLVACASTYYAVFTAIFLAVAAVAALLRDRRWRTVLDAAAAGALLVATMLANMLPDMLYARAHGTNPIALQRVPSGVESFALKITSLLLPPIGTRIPALADLRAQYDTYYPLSSEPQALGLIASCGFLVLLGISVVGLVAMRRRAGAERSEPGTTLGLLAALNLAGVLVGTLGGFASVLSFVTPDLRGWNRFSIVLALLSFAAVGLVVDGLGRAAARRAAWGRGRRALAGLVACGTVLAIGGFDQAIYLTVPDYQRTAADWGSDERFFRGLEADLPPGAMVFELPALTYPEGAAQGGVYPSEMMVPFLHTATLRWSGGAITGRPGADWGQPVAAEATSTMLDDLCVAGFVGVVTNQFAMRGDPRTEELVRELGPAGRTSEDGRWAFYDLRERGADVVERNSPDVLAARREHVLEPVMLYPGTGLVAAGTADGPTWTMVGRSGTLLLDNPRREHVEVVIAARVLGAASVAGVTISGGGLDRWLPLGSGAVQQNLRVDAPPGRTTISLSIAPASIPLTADSQVIISHVAVSEPAAVTLAR